MRFILPVNIRSTTLKIQPKVIMPLYSTVSTNMHRLRELIKKAEEWGRSKGLKYATVFTLKEWSVCSLYQKLGYQIEFERKGHSKGSVGCYLIKNL